MPKTLLSLIEEAQRHTIYEALYYTGDTRSGRHDAWKGEGGPLGPSWPGPPRSAPDRGRKKGFEWYTPLTTTCSEILNHVERQNILKRLNPLRLDPCKWDCIKYCRYHRDYGNDTKNYFELKEEIEKFICRGRLRQFIAHLEGRRGQLANQWAPHLTQEAPPMEPLPTQLLVHEIHTIVNKLGHSGTLNESRK